MTDSFNLSDWSWKHLGPLKIVEVVCYWISGISFVVALIMLIRYLKELNNAITPAVYFLSLGIALIITGVSLKALRLLTEHTKVLSVKAVDGNFQIRALEKNVNEITTAVAEIADGVRESN